MTDAPERPRDWLDELYAETVSPSRTAPLAEHIRGGARYDWRKSADPLADTHQPPAGPEAETGAAEETPLDPAEQPGPTPAAEHRPAWLQPQPSYYPTVPAVLPAAQAAPAALSPRTRSLIYNATAAATGWGTGLLDRCSDALTTCGAEAGIGPALILGIGSCITLAHFWDRRTRHWWIGLAWAARVPLATAITALALYAPASQT
ncbi:hypothetical protein OHB07_16230 [Streptomyces sp. NBC_00111]|uniref:hypothetical protein n=1 Tax=Streptomyces sp. NBC_00111 TaxID=2975655 RepID=UPI0032517DB1